MSFGSGKILFYILSQQHLIYLDNEGTTYIFSHVEQRIPFFSPIFFQQEELTEEKGSFLKTHKVLSILYRPTSS